MMVVIGHVTCLQAGLPADDATIYNKVINLITDNSCNPIFEKILSKWLISASLIIVQSFA